MTMMTMMMTHRRLRQLPAFDKRDEDQRGQEETDSRPSTTDIADRQLHRESVAYC